LIPQATGSVEFAAVTLSVLKDVCLEEVSYDTAFTSTPEGQALLRDLRAMDCPAHCSYHGHCNNGTYTLYLSYDDLLSLIVQPFMVHCYHGKGNSFAWTIYFPVYDPILMLLDYVCYWFGILH
jgi:hypothetical protein